jgi:dTDP-4-amino-4,6-dideoxygalactose transaminase
MVGARPVFVDCEGATGNVTPAAVRAALTPRTRAISLVHFLGIPCDMPGIMAVAAERGLKVIEDAALAVGARWSGTHVGLFGDAACFSFYPVKHVTTAEGGMFVTRHAAVAEAVASLRAFNYDRSRERTPGGVYDVVALGLNYRMSELQAALGRSQLRRLEENLSLRRANFQALQTALRGLRGLRVLAAQAPEARSSDYCLGVVLEGALGARRAEVVSRLNAAGVGTSIYYPQPVPRLRYYREKYGYEAGRFPGATEISDCSLALPVGPHVTADDIHYIADALARAVSEVSS